MRLTYLEAWGGWIEALIKRHFAHVIWVVCIDAAQVHDLKPCVEGQPA